MRCLLLKDNNIKTHLKLEIVSASLLQTKEYKKTSNLEEGVNVEPLNNKPHR